MKVTQEQFQVVCASMQLFITLYLRIYMFYNIYFIDKKFCLFKNKYYLCGVEVWRLEYTAYFWTKNLQYEKSNNKKGFNEKAELR